MNRLFLEFLISGAITIIGIALFRRQWKAFNQLEDSDTRNFYEFKWVLGFIGIGLICFGISIVDLYHFVN